MDEDVVVSDDEQDKAVESVARRVKMTVMRVLERRSKHDGSMQLLVFP